MDRIPEKLLLIIAITMMPLFVAAADFSQSQSLTDTEWETVRSRVALLDKVAYIPSLLPVIMKHQNTLELSDDQKAAFRGWRRKHYQRMIDMMNDVVARRIELSKAALDPSVKSSDLIDQQQTILLLQQELLVIRLSCRELMMETFSAEQWSNFAFILEEYPNFAGLLEH
jgi:hypothetical protein